MSVVLSGALCSTGAASSALTGEIDSAGAFAGAHYVSRYLMMTLERWIGGSVLIEYARAGRPSMAMIGMRRRCSWPSRVGCASARKLFFFQRKVRVGLGKGARACGTSCHFATPEKKRYIDFGL